MDDRPTLSISKIIVEHRTLPGGVPYDIMVVLLSDGSELAGVESAEFRPATPHSFPAWQIIVLGGSGLKEKP